MKGGHTKPFLMLLLAVSLAVLLVAGGMAGCGKKDANGGNGQENGDVDGDDGGEAEGFSGVAFVRDDNIYVSRRRPYHLSHRFQGDARSTI